VQEEQIQTLICSSVNIDAESTHEGKEAIVFPPLVAEEHSCRAECP